MSPPHTLTKALR
uniref:Uncharacterized protein n=1 Tax=Anguilla anguilla TaxID=7936 RepID=A0A0E9PLN3_ANGAN